MAELFARVARASARRPGRVLACVAVLAAVCAAFALRLEPSAATDTLVGRSASSFQATERYRERFGEQSVIVLVRGSVAKLVLTENLNRLVGLEGCLSGNLPKGQAAPGGAKSPCAALAAKRPVQVVYGPGTFINSAVGEIQTQLQVRTQATQAQADKAAEAARKVARARGRSKAGQEKAAESARQVVYAQLLRDLLQINLKYGLGLTGAPTLNDTNFVSALVFDPSRGATTPKARFAYLFPSKDSAVIQVRLESDLTEAERGAAIEQIRRAVAMPEWKLSGASYTVTGAPVVLEDLADALAGSVLRLLVVALVVMALVLALVFRSRLRLVPLLVALAAVAVTFGGMALVGAPLTMASIAVLPVLLGLGVDYVIQYQARVEEAGGDAPRAARLAMPTIATAALATAVGFLVLQLSPVPMVRGFGALLVVGIVIALALALTAGTAALALAARGARDGALARSLRGAAELADGARARLARIEPRAGRRCGCACGAGGGAPAGAGARRGAGAGGDRVGGGLPDQGRLRRRAARAPGPRGGARPAGAAARHGRGGRGRRDRRGRRPHRPQGGGVDARLPGRAAQALRLLVVQRVRQGRAVPGAVAHRPVPRRERRGLARAGAQPARRRARVLLPGRDHEGPQDGEPRVRRAAGLARAPAGDLRRHARAAEAAAGGARLAGRPAGARSPGPTRRCRTRCGASGPCWPACWRWRSRCWRCTGAGSARWCR